MRIWNKKLTHPGLAMSRSLGDVIAHKLGCSHVPEVEQYDLTGNERSIIVASDGVFELLTNEEIAYMMEFSDDPQ
jgi:serine/threonine protein phosphatase PrpC